MSPSPPVDPVVAPSRRILLPLSFAGCGGLLAILFVVLMGCAPFESAMPDPVAQNAQNAVDCECSCTAEFDPLAVPAKNSIAEGNDDGTQAQNAGTVALTQSTLELGNNGLVGVRFDNIGVPQGATITEAQIQFMAGSNSAPEMAHLQIRVVNEPDAPAFTSLANPQGIDLRTLPLIGGLPWDTLGWSTNDAGPEQRTPNLKDLLQAIVSHAQYSHNSAVAFVISGSERRTAWSKNSSSTPPYLTIKYLPKVTKVEFSACLADPNEDVNNACGVRVKNVVSEMANTCDVAKECSCAAKPNTKTFAIACNTGCPDVPLPDDCNPAGFAAATQAKPGQPSVCISNSPLGAALFAQLSTCNLNSDPNDVTVTVFDDDGDVDGRANNSARGRIEFPGSTCLGSSCPVGVQHRLHIGNMKFDGGLLAPDPVITDLTGVGKSSGAITIDAGAGEIKAKSLEHSGRGRQAGDDGETRAYFLDKQNPLPMTIALPAKLGGGWESGGACRMHGDLISTSGVKMSANLRGTLINQPPTADAGPLEQQFECSEVGRATFTLDGSDTWDPDHNVAYFGWFRGSRKGDQVGNLTRVDLAQAVKTTIPYVFKVVDTFGQYDEAWTSVSVVDTTKPTVAAPANVEVECTGPNGQAVDIGKATATDVCDASPDVISDAPQLFFVGPPKTVTWTATDDSGNFSTATQTVQVVDRTPPQITVSLSPTVLWPPDHKLVPITATITVTDICDPDPKVTLDSIVSNEPDNGLGDGDTAGDFQPTTFGTDVRSFLLRAERSGPGQGREYTITYRATDASGNSTPVSTKVFVPKNQAASNR
jgi:hypothetical protein